MVKYKKKEGKSLKKDSRRSMFIPVNKKKSEAERCFPAFRRLMAASFRYYQAG
jgi:hypothetical protein